ncbi:MAG: ADP-ribosylglycohydrolase family protein [Streptobacillus sp.]
MSIVKDSLYGFIVGDTMGVPVEFEDREKLINKSVTSMLGYGSHDVEAGVYSDDTSMTLATMDSIIKQNGIINYNDIADKFCNWVNNNEYTATNKIFDIGMTTKYALIKYFNNKIDATMCGGTNINENGNGSLMRMLPIALYCFYKNIKDDNEIFTLVKNSSSITHAHDISILGCYIYVRYVISLLETKNKISSYNFIKKLDYSMFIEEVKLEYSRILFGDISTLNINDINSSGYVVDTLEAVFWIVLNCSSYNESIIGAINLGGDTDTIGAITGSIAGILYGYDNISKRWISKLRNKDYIDEIIIKFENTFV